MRSRDEKPAGRQELEALKARLRQREQPAPTAGRAPRPVVGAPGATRPPVSPLPAEPERAVSFDDEMARTGVRPVPGAAARVPPARSAQAPPRRPAAGAGRRTESAEDAEAWEAFAATLGGRGAVPPSGSRPASWPTLDLHGFRPEDVGPALREFVAAQRGARPAWVRLIVGRARHGSGGVRDAAAEFLRSSEAVASSRLADPTDGGDGVVLVQLRRRAGA